MTIIMHALKPLRAIRAFYEVSDGTHAQDARFKEEPVLPETPREPEPPYPWCHRKAYCIAKGYCDKDPNCGE